MSTRAAKWRLAERGKALWWRVALWLGLEALLMHVTPPASLESIVPHVLHLAQFAWKAGVASIFIEEVFHVAVAPSLKDIFREAFLPALEECMGQFTRSMADAIAKKDFTFRAISDETHTVPASAAKAMGDDPALSEVKSLLEASRVTEAITQARTLADADPKYRSALLDALVFSSREEDWIAAEELLSECGESRHYRRLAFRYWGIGKVGEAIALAKDGLVMAEKNPDDWLGLAKFRNSLAYYYAEEDIHEKSREATKLIDLAMKAIKGKGDARLEASFLATRGFVRIVFGKDEAEVMKGLRECEKGRDGGARRDLYFHHAQRAHQRLQELSADTTNRPDPKRGGKRGK
ncbi:MAG: hypothetical protein AABO58_15875 [Acidobacteriota bacterium]